MSRSAAPGFSITHRVRTILARTPPPFCTKSAFPFALSDPSAVPTNSGLPNSFSHPSNRAFLAIPTHHNRTTIDLTSYTARQTTPNSATFSSHRISRIPHTRRPVCCLWSIIHDSYVARSPCPPPDLVQATSEPRRSPADPSVRGDSPRLRNPERRYEPGLMAWIDGFECC